MGKRRRRAGILQLQGPGDEATVNYLFIHHNFPGQYQHVATHLAGVSGNRVVFITQDNANRIAGVETVVYRPGARANASTHGWVQEIEQGVIWGQAVFEQCMRLRSDGFRPDIIVGHNGWGETLFVKNVWPDVPLLAYFEFFYRPRGADTGFDPVIPSAATDASRLQVKNAVNLLGMEAADWGQTPTEWQASLYPQHVRSKLSVIHEGIDTGEVRPDPDAWLHLDKAGRRLTAQDEVVTYVSRNLEPYRGFHILMQAIPEILRRRPQAQFLIVGGDEVSYGPAPPPGTTFKQMMIQVNADRLDPRRVHFLGKVPYQTFLNILQVSSVHIYLTYPFVLSWSLMEAMAAGCLVVGSATRPVQEVVQDGENGLLIDFFDVAGLCDRIDAVLDHPDRMNGLRQAARRTIIEHYDLKSVCLPKHLELIERLISTPVQREWVSGMENMPSWPRIN